MTKPLMMKASEVKYPFDEYVCGVTGLTCCGCSLYCEHREDKERQQDETLD